MTAAEKRWTAVMLIVLAAVSAWICVHVWQKNTPEAIDSFRHRFLNIQDLEGNAEGFTAETEETMLTLKWQGTEDTLCYETSPRAVDSGHSVRLAFQAGGTLNAGKRERFGFQSWLELIMLKDGREIASRKIELPFESDKERLRYYTAAVKTEAADAWKVRVTVTPVLDTVMPGSLILKNWEVMER